MTHKVGTTVLVEYNCSYMQSAPPTQAASVEWIFQPIEKIQELVWQILQVIQY